MSTQGNPLSLVCVCVRKLFSSFLRCSRIRLKSSCLIAQKAQDEDTQYPWLIAVSTREAMTGYQRSLCLPVLEAGKPLPRPADSLSTSWFTNTTTS